MSTLFTCSIDDGHPLDLKTADLLAKHGLTGTFYVPIRNMEGPDVMTPEQIRALSQQFEIGSHTMDHCYLKGVDVWMAYDQIMDGKKKLEDTLGREVEGFCYPGGKYRRRDIDLVRGCGFKYARTTVNLCFDRGTSPYEIPTTIQFYPHDRSVYMRNFAEAGNWLKRQDALLLAMQHENWVDRLFALFDHACKRGGTFHLWGHSQEIEQLGAWAELDGFLSYVAAKVDRDKRVRNVQLLEAA